MENQNPEIIARQLQQKIDELTTQLDDLKAVKSQVDLLQSYQHSQKHEGWLFNVFFERHLKVPLDNKVLSHSEKLKRLNFYRSEITLEWNLLSNRVGSYITSQSFLVTAFAISMGNASLDAP